jgi:3-hydroxybutyryl-CoA dehydratase
MPVQEFNCSTLQVGQTERLEVEVTPSAVAAFASLSGDFSPVHVNSDYARSKGFPDCIAHGFLLGAYVSALVGTRLPGKHGVLQSCDLEFRSPLVPPEHIEIVGEVINISAGTGQIVLKITVRTRAGSLLATGKVKSIVREQTPAASI